MIEEYEHDRLTWIELHDSVQALGGKILACDLGRAVHGLEEENLREGVVIVGVAAFLGETPVHSSPSTPA